MMGTEHIPFEDYAELDAVNISALLELDISAKHYQHTRTHPRADKHAYRVGRAFHTATLEARQFPLEYAISEYRDFKTKKARAWKAEREAAGKTVLTQAQYETAWAMADAARADPIAAPYLTGGRHECTLTWDCPRTGIACKGRLDFVSQALIDLKGTRHAVTTAFCRDAGRYRYPTRLSWYRDALRIATGRDLPVVIIAVESVPPHDVVVYEVPSEVLERGRLHYEALMDRLRMCLDSDYWPGVAVGEQQILTPPTWTEPLAEEPILFEGEPLF